MLEDVLLIEEKHRKTAKILYDTLTQHKLKDRVVIGISGESGSGKSELAHVLAEKFKEKKLYTKILHLDDYYIIAPKERNEWRNKHGIENIGLNEINWEKLHQDIQNFKKKQITKLPCVDILTDQIDTLITNFDEVEIIIIEGLYAVHANIDHRIFIDLTYKETKKAQKLRGKEPTTQFRFQVLKREHEVVRKLKEKCDFIINKKYEVKTIT